MENLITVTFPGGKKVNAEVDGRVVSTDQPVHNGGGGTAPEPFTLFMASIGTCAGLYARNFCEAREISIQGMKLVLRYDFNWETKRCDKLYLDLKLPEDFPEKYKKAILKAMDLCTVKRHMMQPPEFIMTAN